MSKKSKSRRHQRRRHHQHIARSAGSPSRSPASVSLSAADVSDLLQWLAFSAPFTNLTNLIAAVVPLGMAGLEKHIALLLDADGEILWSGNAELDGLEDLELRLEDQAWSEVGLGSRRLAMICLGASRGVLVEALEEVQWMADDVVGIITDETGFSVLTLDAGSGPWGERSVDMNEVERIVGERFCPTV